MGGLITKGLNFKIEGGKFIPFKETTRAGKEKGETTIIENPILEEGYDIFTEMDKIKTYLEEEFIPIEVRTAPGSSTQSDGSAPKRFDKNGKVILEDRFGPLI